MAQDTEEKDKRLQESLRVIDMTERNEQMKIQ